MLMVVTADKTKMESAAFVIEEIELIDVYLMLILVEMYIVVLYCVWIL